MTTGILKRRSTRFAHAAGLAHHRSTPMTPIGCSSPRSSVNRHPDYDLSFTQDIGHRPQTSMSPIPAYDADGDAHSTRCLASSFPGSSRLLCFLS